MDKGIVLYRRKRSSIWQCRYKIDGVWQRATTKQQDLTAAKKIAKELLITAEIRKRDNLPVITRKFRHVANLSITKMDNETQSGHGKVSYADYKRVIENYLIPFFGNYSITSVDYAAIERFDEWRAEKMDKQPTRSTLLTHNAALNRVLGEAVDRGFMSEATRPKLDVKGKVGKRRPAFDLAAIRKMLTSFDAWIPKGRTDKSIELRHLLRDYVEVLLDTGARPGVELMNLQWKQVTYGMEIATVEARESPKQDPNEPPDEPSEEHPDVQPDDASKTEVNRYCYMTVSGKTGTRDIQGNNPTVKALVRIIERNYGMKNKHVEPFKDIAIPTNDDYVFRTKAKEEPTSYQNMFEEFLKANELLVDPRTNQKRVLYSLRHTYATLALTHDAYFGPS